MSQQATSNVWTSDFVPTAAPICICLLGTFRVLRFGLPAALRADSKGAALLSALALRHDRAIPRETLLETIWPNSEPSLASQSLNSLVYSLHRLLADGIRGAEPILCSNSSYRLNGEHVAVDITLFDETVAAGEQFARAGYESDAMVAFSRAVQVYGGDIYTSSTTEALVERERLRASYLTLLARLADHDFAAGDYTACLASVHRLLSSDPCREDAHRLAMRCYVRRGERAQALRQYRTCEAALRSEFDAAPEPATVALFTDAQRDPASI
jgi:DNA-binding SARP family transcriptional activator